MLIIGIDENGLGPILGPLIVTATAFEADSYSPEMFWQAADAELVTDDSKKIFSSSKLGSAEAAVWAWLKKFGINPLTFAGLYDDIVLPMPLKRLCTLLPAWCAPSASALPCFAAKRELDWINNESKGLSLQNIIPKTVRAFSICPGAYNLATEKDEQNKFALDFMLMLKLVENLSVGHNGDVLVLCGKVGATNKYGSWFKRYYGGLWMPEEETAQISTYRIVPYGKISFIRDGDASHLPIAAASMIGKYIRELAMHDINSLLSNPGDKPVSGYRDKVTARFIENTKTKRNAMKIPDSCFLRNS